MSLHVLMYIDRHRGPRISTQELHCLESTHCSMEIAASLSVGSRADNNKQPILQVSFENYAVL
jgi:hypothetical protein